MYVVSYLFMIVVSLLNLNQLNANLQYNCYERNDIYLNHVKYKGNIRL